MAYADQRGNAPSLGLQLPDGVRDERPAVQEQLADSYVERRAVYAQNGLAGKSIVIAGLESTITDVLVRVEHLDASTQLTRLTPSQPSFVVEAAPGIFEVAPLTSGSASSTSSPASTTSCSSWRCCSSRAVAGDW